MHGIPNHPNRLVQYGSCLVMGVGSMPRNAQEYDKLVTTEVDKSFQAYKQEHPEVEITDEHIKRATLITRDNYCSRHTTNFRVFRYVDKDGKSMADGNPYQGVMTNWQWLAIFYLDKPQEITVLPYGDPKNGPHRNLFYDAQAKIAASRWGYGGNLETALYEFSKIGFTFNMAKLPTTLEDNRQWLAEYQSTSPNRRISGILMGTNLSLEEVLQIISQKT